MKKPFAFLACPYSSPNPNVRENRVHLANIAAAKLVRKGYIVFSPLTHSHAIATDGHIDPLDPLWYEQAKFFLRLADRLYVLMLRGWDKSDGVRGEIEIAKSMNIPVEYIKP